MSTATAVLGAVSLPSLDHRYRHFTHNTASDSSSAASRRGSPCPGTVTLTADQYTYLISLIHLQSTPPLSLSLPHAPAPSHPRSPPARARSPASAPLPPHLKSLVPQFPHVAPDLLLAIAHHALDPRELYKLDEHFRPALPSACTPPLNDLPDYLASSSASPSCIRTTTREFITRFYPSFSALVGPLSTYFHILLALAESPSSPSPESPSSAPPPSQSEVYAIASASTQYLARLVGLSEEHHWAVVLPYHMAFHRARMDEMKRGDYSGWGCIDNELLMGLIEERERVVEAEEREREMARAQCRSRSGLS